MTREPIAWLYGLQHFGVKLGLDNIRALLDLLGHPERGRRRLHVAGTNGKGSVAAMLDAALLAHGVRSGLFTSPHLVRPDERIRIAGRDIPTPGLLRLLERLRDAIDAAVDSGALEAHPSFFEVVTAAALVAFRDAALDVDVLEVGLGGRLDATNAVDADVAVVVTVDLDHTKTLGGTLEAIAAEKGGIVKPGRAVVCGVTQHGPRAVLRAIAAERGSAFVDALEEAAIEPGPRDVFAVRTRRCLYDRLRLPLEGTHQRDNARVALVALERFADAVGLDLSADAVRSGLAATRWPGRLQWIAGRPRLLLDGAHNGAGARILADYLAARAELRPVLLFGATQEKDPEDLLAPLLPWVRGLVVARPPIDRAMDPATLATWARPRIAPIEIVPDPGPALEAARALAGPDGVVLVAGSLYLVGGVLTYLDPEPAPGPVPM